VTSTTLSARPFPWSFSVLPCFPTITLGQSSLSSWTFLGLLTCTLKSETDGASPSTTVTTTGQEMALPAASLAVEVTVVTPAGKLDPDAGVDSTVTGGEQLSEAVVVKATGALHAPGEVETVIGAGQEIAGGASSTTVTVAVAWLVAPMGSTTVSRTDVVPGGYGPAGDWVIVSASPSASDDPASTDAVAPQLSSAATTTFRAVATGAWFGGLHAPMQAPATLSV